GDGLEGVFVPLDLVGDLDPLLQGRIATFANHVESPFALLPSRLERDLGEGAYRVDRRHVPQAVPVPPELASVGLNAQEQAPAVPERVRLGLRLSGFELANGEELEGHVYNAFRCVRYSHRYTHSPWLGLACRRPHQTLNPCESTTYATSLDVQSPRRTTFVVIDHQQHVRLPPLQIWPSRPACTSSAARSTARALFSVSCHSFSGTESATMPAAAST